jgi:DNA-binding Xre family transcriptional regulator
VMYRLRIPELLAMRPMTPKELARRSRGQISYRTACRLQRTGGRVRRFDAVVLDALCEIFQVTATELFVRCAARRSHR